MNTPLVPIPRVPVTVRPGTPADLPFIDSLQKLHSKQVGWMPMKSLEQKIAGESVLIAEEDLPRRHEDTKVCLDAAPPFVPSCLRGENSDRAPVGYVIATDRYFKRDDVGIIYQLVVAPQARRGLVGATLLRAQFARSAYGCRLYCCWCAQDIEANRFWESMGFVPLASRAGSRDKGRVHIFWQRRTRAGDTTTPWWFPAKTDAGAMREDRLVLPIPPGRHWSEEMPMLRAEGRDQRSEVRGQRSDGTALTSDLRPLTSSPKRARVQFGPPGMQTPIAVVEHVTPGAQPAKPKRERAKADPKLVAAARELRDRWLERVNADPAALPSEGKYDVSRTLSEVEGSRPITDGGTRPGGQPLLAA